MFFSFDVVLSISVQTLLAGRGFAVEAYKFRGESSNRWCGENSWEEFGVVKRFLYFVLDFLVIPGNLGLFPSVVERITVFLLY